MDASAYNDQHAAEYSQAIEVFDGSGKSLALIDRNRSLLDSLFLIETAKVSR